MLDKVPLLNSSPYRRWRRWKMVRNVGYERCRAARASTATNSIFISGSQVRLRPR